MHGEGKQRTTLHG